MIQVLNLLHKDVDGFPETAQDEVRPGMFFALFVIDLFVSLLKNGSNEDPDRNEPPYFVQQFTEKLPEFVSVLKSEFFPCPIFCVSSLSFSSSGPSNLPAHRNAGCNIPNPVGFTRLRVLEFVVGLIGTVCD